MNNNPVNNEGKDLKVQPSGMVKVKFLRAHPAFSYSKGNIGFLTIEKADLLSHSMTEIIDGKTNYH